MKPPLVALVRSQTPCIPLTPPPVDHLQGLTKLLSDHAPEAMKEQKFENYFGRKIAVDASMHIYSFLVSSTDGGDAHLLGDDNYAQPLPSFRLQVVVGRQGDQLLTSETGEVTR